MALRDRLLGDPARLDGPGLARGVRHGSEAHAIRCLRELGERDDAEVPAFLAGLLGDARAAVRRAAAHALGQRGGPAWEPALAAAWATERTEEGRVALAVARVRCGAPVDAVLDAVRALDARTLATPGGRRQPAALHGAGGMADRVRQILGGPAPVDRAALLARRRADAARPGADARRAQLDLAALRHPADHEGLLARFPASGRRGEHALLQALGLSGDPRALPLLRDALQAMDVDPGRGFAQRRLAAVALGRLGLREAVPALLRALEAEARDYEGRPGAGMGVQYPVRTDLLWALGEIGDAAAVPVLVRYLGDVTGSALGGFHLPAMDALVKLGPAAAPAVRAVAGGRDDTAAAHAVAVLAALGDDVSAWANDARPPVRAVLDALADDPGRGGPGRRGPAARGAR